ncbi:acid protease [Agrocybe pediades]|nr:acid protease [Agrocybe pediades]
MTREIVSADTITSNFADDSVQGIMGLAFTNLAVTGVKPFFLNLASNPDELDAPVIGFWIQRTNPQSEHEVDPGGVVTIGGANSSFFTGEIDFLDMPSTSGEDPKYWVLNVAKVSVNGKDIPISTAGDASLAAIDTGTTLLGAPSDAAAAIWKAAGGKPLNDGSGMFAIPCSSQVEVAISFGGKTWTIDPRDMIFESLQGSSTTCVGAIFDVEAGTSIQNQPGSGTPAWIIGDTFLKNVYSVFRVTPPSIGFAQLSNFALDGAPGLNTSPSPQSGSGQNPPPRPGAVGGESAASYIGPISITSLLALSILAIFLPKLLKI